MRGTLVLLMAVERLGAIADTLIARGKDPDTPVAVVQDGSLSGQRVLYSTLRRAAADIAQAGVRPPAIVVVGPVVSLAEAQHGHPA
jgi:uroporphyrin-III C-methyltransferase/precorrin-2 dehydrogenase/sirohydrochlorin ferrochelatase